MIGFQRISSKHLEVRNIISYFTEVIEDCEDKLDAKNMSRLLLGIQHFESEYVEVMTAYECLRYAIVQLHYYFPPCIDCPVICSCHV